MTEHGGRIGVGLVSDKRRTSRAVCLGLVIVSLAACASEPVPKTLPTAYQLDGAGVQLLDRDLRIDFGRTSHSSISAMTKLVGAVPVEDAVCDDLRQVVWRDGTRLFFEGGDFRGWRSLDGSAGRVCDLG